MSEIKIKEVSITHPVTEGLITAVDVPVSALVLPPVIVPVIVVVGRSVFNGVEVTSTIYWIYHLPLVVSSVS
jgi:hypothetical protein